MANATYPVPVPEGINQRLDSPGNSFMTAVFGNPRRSYGNECRPVTNSALKNRMVTARAGPLRVTGLDKAVASLKAVMADIARTHPDIHAELGTAGMLCCRTMRGSATAISNHSWGTAIDLTIGGKLDRRGDRKVQLGLALVAPIFNRHSWYWGAGFPVEDAMHFEASRQLISTWELEDPAARAVTPEGTQVLAAGDRGSSVAQLQALLNRKGESLVEDGMFGLATLAAVRAFQARSGLTVDGMAGKATLDSLQAQ